MSKTALALATIAALVATLIPSGVSLAAGDGVTINEIRIDQPSTDNDEYFELSGPPDTALTGHTYLVIGDGPTNGDAGVIETVIDLNTLALSPEGLLLVELATNSFENSDNVTHLLVQGFTGAVGNDLDTDNDGVLDSTTNT